MAKDYAKQFYSSKAWQTCREAYAKSRQYLCEDCLRRGIYRPGEIVHHKIHITPVTIDNPEVALSFKNLELLCRVCHARVHDHKGWTEINKRKKEKRDAEKRFYIDENGKVYANENKN